MLIIYKDYFLLNGSEKDLKKLLEIFDFNKIPYKVLEKREYPKKIDIKVIDEQIRRDTEKRQLKQTLIFQNETLTIILNQQKGFSGYFEIKPTSQKEEDMEVFLNQVLEFKEILKQNGFPQFYESQNQKNKSIVLMPVPANGNKVDINGKIINVLRCWYDKTLQKGLVNKAFYYFKHLQDLSSYRGVGTQDVRTQDVRTRNIQKDHDRNIHHGGNKDHDSSPEPFPSKSLWYHGEKLLENSVNAIIGTLLDVGIAERVESTDVESAVEVKRKADQGSQDLKSTTELKKTVEQRENDLKSTTEVKQNSDHSAHDLKSTTEELKFKREELKSTSETKRDAEKAGSASNKTPTKTPKPFEKINGACSFCRKDVLKKQMVLDLNKYVVLVNYMPYAGTKIHVMLVPKDHHQDMATMNKADLCDLQNIGRAVTEALRTVMGVDVFEIISFTQNGVCAGQTVPHLHIHWMNLPRFVPYFIDICHQIVSIATQKAQESLNADQMAEIAAPLKPAILNALKPLLFSTSYPKSLISLFPGRDSLRFDELDSDQTDYAPYLLVRNGLVEEQRTTSTSQSASQVSNAVVLKFTGSGYKRL